MKRCSFGTATVFLIVCLCFFQSLCRGLDYVPCQSGLGGDLKSQAESPLVLTIDTSQARQTITGFGASDAWSTQFVGQWPDEKRQAIADLLFETDLDKHHDPQGIGLSSWRFNIGAGSSRQNNITDSWRKADTFLDEDFDGYDWSRCPGQRWFLQVAKAKGVDSFTAFVNSPPINMTRNGMAFCQGISGSTNLSWDRTDDFAEYLATILAHFRDAEGIEFDAISPFNEPNWQWNGNSQEGCRYSNADIKRIVMALCPKLQERQLATEIEVPEAGDMSYLYEYVSSQGDYIDSFFSPGSYTYIGDRVAPRVAGHSYFTCWPEGDRLVGWRETLRAKLNQYPGLGYAATEYCILIPSDSWVPSSYRDYGSGRDLGIDPALWIARVIHHDLTIAEAASWSWWLAVSPYGYKDGLVYVDKSVLSGNYYESKMLWAMGNFSRFIRPGMKRVTVGRSDNAAPDEVTKDLMVSAYYKLDDDVVVLVFVNWASANRPVRFNFTGTGVRTLIPYVTQGSSADKDNLTAYKALNPDDTITIPARSIVTLVGLPTDSGDFDKDGKTDLHDFAVLAGQWKETNCSRWPGACQAGFINLASLGQNWLTDIRLIARWDLDETSGSIAHDSVGGYNGILHGDPMWQAGQGQADGALVFDGVDDYVETPFVLDPIDRPFSLYAWIRGGDPGQVVVSQINGLDWLLTDSASGTLMTNLSTGGRVSAPLISQTAITDGHWHHIGLVWDGSYRTLCVDGKEVATDSVPLRELASSTGGLYFGVACDLAVDCFWSGHIDHVRLYNQPVFAKSGF